MEKLRKIVTRLVSNDRATKKKKNHLKIGKTVHLLKEIVESYKPNPKEEEYLDFHVADVLDGIQEELLSLKEKLNTFLLEPHYGEFVKLICSHLRVMGRQAKKLTSVHKNILPIERHTFIWSKLQIRIFFCLHELMNIPFNGNAGIWLATKGAALHFWTNNFGNNVVVKIEEFSKMLICEQKGTLTNCQKEKLENMLDWNGSGFISLFGFHVFCQLFGDWFDILFKWKVLCVYHTGFFGVATKISIHFHLAKFIEHPGVYVFTPSVVQPGKWVITYVDDANKIVTTTLHNRTIVHALLQGYNNRNLIYPDNQPCNPEINMLLVRTSQADVHLVSSQRNSKNDSKSDGESQGELCEICYLHTKDSSINPCKHHICHRCIAKWTMRNKTTCPFCRSEIQSIKVLRISFVDLPIQNSDLSSSSFFVPLLHDKNCISHSTSIQMSSSNPRPQSYPYPNNNSQEPDHQCSTV